MILSYFRTFEKFSLVYFKALKYNQSQTKPCLTVSKNMGGNMFTKLAQTFNFCSLSVSSWSKHCSLFFKVYHFLIWTHGHRMLYSYCLLINFSLRLIGDGNYCVPNSIIKQSAYCDKILIQFSLFISTWREVVAAVLVFLTA